MKPTSKLVFFTLALLCPLKFASAGIFEKGEVPIQVGGFKASQGESQFVPIQNLIGNYQSVSKDKSGAVLTGIGYLVKGLEKDRFDLFYGANLFFLNRTEIRGGIMQEVFFNNLAYSYKTQHLPVYALVKVKLKDAKFENIALVVNGGIGPNFSKTSSYCEQSLDGGFTIPDQNFRGKSSTQFSATAGIGLRFENALGSAPIECGYQFYYLGKRNLESSNVDVFRGLRTGSTYANAFICGVSI